MITVKKEKVEFGVGGASREDVYRRIESHLRQYLGLAEHANLNEHVNNLAIQIEGVEEVYDFTSSGVRIATVIEFYGTVSADIY